MTEPERETADRIIEALRAGEVPARGLEHLATGIDPLVESIERDLDRCGRGQGRFRFLRGEFGSGKTFFLHYVAAVARRKDFATMSVRASYPDVPLHKPIDVYREALNHLATPVAQEGALRQTLDTWFSEIHRRVMEIDGIEDPLSDAFQDAVDDQINQLLHSVVDAAPVMAQAISGYHRALVNEDQATARGLLQFLSGDENVAFDVKREAGLKGSLDHEDVLPLLHGWSVIFRQVGYSGIVLLIDEVERLLRVRRSDLRERGLQTIHNWINALSAEELPNMLMLVAGTPRFFESDRGVPSLPELKQRIHVSFRDDGFDDLDAPQVRLPRFSKERLVEVGRHVRDLYSVAYPDAEVRLVDDTFLERLASELTQAFNGHIEVTPRQFLRELVSELSRVRQYGDEYDPHEQYAFDEDDARQSGLEPTEEAALEGVGPDDSGEFDASSALEGL